mmetsp:Transcript_24482/g.71809  ORF Transcript_24482/g.71809 Transcript_24482/m.71809 type:complete len:211 (-) Transcript_24482:79-711(-)
MGLHLLGTPLQLSFFSSSRFTTSLSKRSSRNRRSRYVTGAAVAAAAGAADGNSGPSCVPNGASPPWWPPVGAPTDPARPESGGGGGDGEAPPEEDRERPGRGTAGAKAPEEALLLLPEAGVGGGAPCPGGESPVLLCTDVSKDERVAGDETGAARRFCCISAGTGVSTATREPGTAPRAAPQPLDDRTRLGKLSLAAIATAADASLPDSV